MRRADLQDLLCVLRTGTKSHPVWSEHSLNQSIADQEDRGLGAGGGDGRFDPGSLFRRRAEKSYFRDRAPLSNLDGIVIMDFKVTEQYESTISLIAP